MAYPSPPGPSCAILNDPRGIPAPRGRVRCGKGEGDTTPMTWSADLLWRPNIALVCHAPSHALAIPQAIRC
jgi:hypothetical protein